MDGDGPPATAAVVELPQAIPTTALAGILEESAEAEAPSAVIHILPMRWGGHGNVIAAAGTALLDFVGMR